MKRPRSPTSVETDSSVEPDNTDADEDFDPRPAAKRRKTGGRRSKATPQKKSRASKTPRTSTKAAKATGSKSTIHLTASGTAELSSAISANARLPPCKLGAVEIVTFFPLHTRWPELGLRLYRNGWKSLSIAKATLHAREKLNYRDDRAVENRRSTNAHQVLRNGKYWFEDEDFTPSGSEDMTLVTTYDASAYAPRDNVPASSMFTAKLVDIARGVQNFPKGEDCGVVTQAIDYAVRNRRDDLTTADIPRLAAQHGFQDPLDSFTTQWDQHGQDRIEARIELTGNYRKERFEKAYESESSDLE